MPSPAELERLKPVESNVTAPSPEGISIALARGYYTLTRSDMADACRTILAACPTCEFAGLEAGKSYQYRAYQGATAYLIEVKETTAKGGQAVVNIDRRCECRIYKGKYSGTFTELSADLIAMIGLTHEIVVRTAKANQLDIPPEVRREYPALFIEIPERFALDNKPAVERVVNAFSPSWVMRKDHLTTATLDAQIEEAHRDIARLQDTRTQAVVVNPDNGQDYDRYIENDMANIDFYRWLRRLVDVGGVFYIPGT